MGTKAALSGGIDFEICPLGIHNAVCAAVMPLGIRETKFGDKNQIKFIFLSEQCDSEGRNFMIFSKPFTLSANQKSSLYSFCSSWGALPFNGEKEFSELDMEDYEYKRITINVTHNIDGDNTWVNIATVMPPMANNTFSFDDSPYVIRVKANLKRNSGVFNSEDMKKPEEGNNALDELAANPDYDPSLGL